MKVLFGCGGLSSPLPTVSSQQQCGVRNGSARARHATGWALWMACWRCWRLPREKVHAGPGLASACCKQERLEGAWGRSPKRRSPRETLACAVLAPGSGVGAQLASCCSALVEDDHRRARSTRGARNSARTEIRFSRSMHHVETGSGLGRLLRQPWKRYQIKKP